MKESHQVAAINLSRDICLKMIEQRALSPDKSPEALNLLRNTAENLFGEVQDGDGLWLVRLARDITLKMIERKMASSPEAVSAALTENCSLLTSIAAELEPLLKVASLNTARDISLKFLETGRLSRVSFPDFFKVVAKTAGNLKFASEFGGT